MLGLKALLILAAYISITVAAPPSSSGSNVNPIPPDPDLPQDCPSGQWYWEAVSRCIRFLEKKDTTSDPSGIFLCPERWTWNEELGHCAPRRSDTARHACPNEYLWKNYGFVCIRKDTVQPNPECGQNEFYWEAKSRCVPIIEKRKRFPRPDNYQCPQNWYWNTDFRHCAPRDADVRKNDCPARYKWRKYRFFCVPNPLWLANPAQVANQCPPNQWPWKLSSNVCLPTGKSGETAAPSDGYVCPDEWYWHTILQRCAPPSQSVKARCPKEHYRNNIRLTCVPVHLDPPQSCPPEQWLWKATTKSLCLPTLEPRAVNPPPDGYVCPDNWSWRTDLNHCVPSRAGDVSKACKTGRLLDNTQFHCVINPDPFSPLPPKWQFCPENQWLWKTMLKCLPNGGASILLPARPGIVCPEFWYWHKHNHCAPPLPQNLGSYCPGGHTWNYASYSCELDRLQHNARKA